MNSIYKQFPAISVSRPVPLVLAIRSLLMGGLLLGGNSYSIGAGLPVPADVLVAPGAGNVLPPVISGNTMTIRQLSEKATLDWQSFNIARENSVKFDQPSSTSVALNRIHQSDPSKIFGTLTANGQIYLVNQNGFVFGKNSQVNVNSLVATTLNISEQAFQLGITQAFDQNKLPSLSAVNDSGQSIKQLYLKDPYGNPVLDQNGHKVKVQIFVEEGANIRTNSRDGRIILAAPSVTNEGNITSPDGQVILAASQDKVYLQQADAGSDIRGLLVEVGTGGDVNNIGKILAERGNASLIGFAVNQNGLVSATTSVKLNGSVRLLAREGIQDPIATGGVLAGASTRRNQSLDDGIGLSAQVKLAKNSVTSVELTSNKSERAVDAQVQARSNIEIAGHKVFLDSGSTIKANSGEVKISAEDNLANDNVKGDGRIYLDRGARIDVSGVKNVDLPMSRNVVKVELRSNELRDAPLQRKGILYGKTISVDIRRVGADGSIPIADISGALDRISRNIDERSTSGGTIALESSGDIVTRSGSILNFSGGSVAYRGGFIKTTQLLSNGKIYDIAEADPDRHYDSLFGEFVKVSRKWGITQRWAIPGVGLKRYEPGYIEGKDGGSLTIAAFESELDGILQGKTINGPQQRTGDTQAAGTSLSLDLNRDNLLGKQDVVFAKTQPVNIGPFDPIPRKVDSSDSAALTITPTLFSDAGIRHVTIKTNGSLRIERGAQVTLPENGSIDLAAVGFDVQGTIRAPSGDVTLKPASISVGEKSQPQASAITLGGNAQIQTGGEWVNDLLNADKTTTVALDGGHVSLQAEQGNLRLEQGSRIDVSGGAWLRRDGSPLATGKGGSIQLIAASNQTGTSPANLELGGELSGWGLEQGGSLRLVSNEVFIGQDSSLPDPAFPDRHPLTLTPAFFQQGGFGDYSIGSNFKGISVSDGVWVRPLQRNRELLSDPASRSSRPDILQLSRAVTLPDSVRKPANLTLTMAQTLAQDRTVGVTVGANAGIETDPQGSITLNSDTSVVVNGSLNAPAGHIALNVTPPAVVDQGFFDTQGIWLGAGSSLLARGVFKSQPDGTGLVMGDVLAGGDVWLNANRGYIVTDKSSRIDVAGATATLQFRQPVSSGPSLQLVSREIPSAGGSIHLTAGEGIIADGELNGRSGGKGAGGGSLAVELNGQLRTKSPDPIPGGVFPDEGKPSSPRAIIVATGTSSFLPDGFTTGDAISSDSYNGKGLLSADALNEGQFGSISLKTDAYNNRDYVGRIEFQGDVKLNTGREIVLDTPSLSWSPLDVGNQAKVELNAPRVALGSTQSRIDVRLASGGFNSTLAPDAKTGMGVLNVNAKAIDLIGGLSLSEFGTLDLKSEGDVRAIGIRSASDTKNFLGQLNIAGDLNITGSQFYPATLTDYTIKSSGADATISVNGRGSPTKLLSAGGSLSLTAPNIRQSGVIRAPFGSLSLNASTNLELAAGSLTSVSGKDTTVPFGRGSGGLYWLFPLNASGSNNRVIDTPPEKRITLSGQSVNLAQGATVDLSGGGDLYGHEFITGPGGSKDVLNPADPGFVPKFAVMPGIYGIATPYDPSEFSSAGLKMGDSVYLGGAAGLEQGWYSLLPAHYALLPGAYLVTPQSGTRDLTSGQSFSRLDGSTVVAGRYGVAGTAAVEARWQGFAVEPGAVARTRSQFQNYSANQFFADKAKQDDKPIPRLPEDAGSLALSSDVSLALNATLVAAASESNGKGGQVDINAASLAIVAKPEDVSLVTNGTVGLVADDLNRLNVESLLLGGLRNQEKTGQRLQVMSDSVNIAGNVRLTGREILLGARNRVTVESGATVESTARVDLASDDLLVSNRVTAGQNADSDGALIRVSALNQVDVTRDRPLTGNGGVLVVEEGARLKATGSMLLDSTRDTRFAGTIDMQGGSLALKSSTISLGSVPATTGGLVLANTAFQVDELKLTSASDVNLYGAVNLDTRQLAIDAAAINGYDNRGQQSSINADTIMLSNSGAKTAATGAGTGELSLSAKSIRLGEGNYAIKGFRQVALSASEALLGDADIDGKGAGSGLLSVAGDMKVSAGHISGNDGATTRIDASGHSIDFSSLPLPSKPADTTGLGVRWSVNADAITSTARFDLPAGILDLTAHTGDVQIGAGSRVDVSGQAHTFGNLTRYTSAGGINLTAEKGSVGLVPGASLNLSGAAMPVGANQQFSHAGSLAINAPITGFDWNGEISANASAGSKEGRFELDASHFGDGGFSALNSKLASAGFTERVSLRQRSGDISLSAGDTVKAHDFALIADAGAVDLAGTINASGVQGGRVSIKGSEGIVLGGGSVIDAHATGEGQKGGQLILDTVATRGKFSGVLDLSASALINVAGAEGGSVHLRTGRDDSTGQVAVTDVNARIQGSARSVLEAARTYTGVSTVTDSSIAQYQTDTAAFMQKAEAVTDHSGANLILAPGIDIRSSGDLALTGTWDFMAKDNASGKSLWRWEGVPGYLSLTATGHLDIQGALTDGFATAALPDPLYGTVRGVQFQDTLQPGYSWSYTLSAGKDVRLADSYLGPNPVRPTVKSDRQVLVRTGTGSIDINAGNDILFTADATDPKSAAAVYTMGRPADYTFDDLLQGRIPNLEPLQPNEDLATYLQRQDASSLAEALRWGTYGAQATGYGFLAEYPTHGGDINLTAAGDIKGIQTGQLMTDWMVRSGTWNNDPADLNRRPTAWGINVSGSTADKVTTGTDLNREQVVINEKGRRFFNQNVGALGGGDVSIRAGRDISDLSVMIPTSGKPMGVLTTPRNGGRPDLRAPEGATDTRWTVNGTAISGGGDLLVDAGGDIRGGEYYTGLGSGRLEAGGSVLASSSKLGAVVGLGDARFELSARKDLVLGSAFNPTLLPQQSIPDNASRKNAFFFTYSGDSSLSLSAIGGNMVLQNDTGTLKKIKSYTAQNGTGFEMSIYPGTLRAMAPAGDIRIDDSLNLSPSSQGQLEILAGNNISTDRTASSTLKLNMSDADPTLLPTIALPEARLLGDLSQKDIRTRERFNPESPLASAIHGVTPLHQADTSKASIIAKTGDISFTGDVQMKLFLPKVAEVKAGRDIRNFSVYNQNLAATDITRIQAGRDLIFDSRLDSNGGVIPVDQRLQLDGPGRLQVLAGRDINLGSSTGILSIGNLFNRALPGDGGADIDVLTGLSDTLDYAGFINKYLQPNGQYLAGLTLLDSQGNDSLAGLNSSQRLASIEALPEEAKLALVQNVLFKEIKASASAAAVAPEYRRGALYQRGLDAINTLFPGSKYEGDLALVFSQIKTLNGGDINIDTPGGKVDVGLAGKVGGISKQADQLGIVAQQSGDVNAYVRSNFNVNQSRVFTMGGGDIAIWSSIGDIDAGKGAKSAISAPPPVTSIDENGNIVTIFPPIVSGSGIQAITPADRSKGQGNVFLAAPKGVVNAGEAGISGGQVVIAASAVVGASNIQASGGTVGVPTAVAPPVVPSGAASAAAGAAKASGADTAGKTGNESEGAAKSASNSILNADVVGYGECSVADVMNGTTKCGGT
jgi:filamentous hemagglutinin